MQNTRLDEQYLERTIKKWEKVIDAGDGIKDPDMRAGMAVLLENTQSETDGRARRFLTESMPAYGMGAAPGSDMPFDNYTPGTYGGTDNRVPTIVVPLLRRIYPELIAHDLCGVQPLNGPIGFVFALRAEYGSNRAHGTQPTVEGSNLEIGFNNNVGDFAGAKSGSTTSAGTMWEAYAGTTSASLDGGTVMYDGTGASLATSEGAQFSGGTFPLSRFKLVKATVEAQSRKMGAYWSLELAEDMQNQFGVNVDSEMANIITYEIAAGIDRQIISEMVRSAIIGSNTSTWTPVSADGRNQIERIGTLYTHLLDKVQKIAQTSRRGAGNFVVASPKVVALLQRFGMKSTYGAELKSGGSSLPTPDSSGIGAINRVGILETGQALYRDTFAAGNYMLIGYKGAKFDTGVVYAPYIPVQLIRTIDPIDLNPKIGARCRDAIIGESGRPTGWQAGNYYQFVNITGLTSALAGDDSGNRVLTYA